MRSCGRYSTVVPRVTSCFGYYKSETPSLRIYRYDRNPTIQPNIYVHPNMSGVRKRKHRVKKTSDFWTLPDGKRLHEQHKHGLRTALPAGCGIFTLPPEDLTSMRALCETVLERLPKLVPWGDGWADQKGRGYAMLSNLSDFPDVQSMVANGILMHDVDSALCTDASVRKAATEKHNFTVKNAFVSMDPPQPHIDAIQSMIEQVNAFLQDPIHSRHLQSYERDAVRLSNLVAIQPNFHNGDDYLPLHLDNPRHDGFGVVIVTVALWGSADVVLVDDGDAEGFVSSPKKSVKEENGSVQDNDRSEERGCQENVSVNTRKMEVETPLCCEGGIVFKNGAYLVTKEEEENAEATSGLGLAADDNNTSSHATSLSTCRDFTHNTLPADTTDLPTSSTNTTLTHNIRKDTCSNSTHIDHPGTANTTTSTENASSSTSWVFPLHPGQCYVLSGPARNKCAHGIVVHLPAAPVEGTKRQCTQAEDATSLATTKPYSITTDTSTLNLTNTSTINAVDTTRTTNTSSKIEPCVPSSCNNSAMHTTSTTPTTTTTNTEIQPKEWKGRVSLNFRFGIHTPEQAWHEVDRHWT